MPAKLARYIVTTDPARHLLLIPRGELELGYDLFGITIWEAEDLIEQHGSVQEWLQTIYYSRELRREFMSNGFHRTSERGRFSSFDSESNCMSKGEVIPGQILTFDGEFMPGTIVRVHSYPEAKPIVSNGHAAPIWIEPDKSRPVPSGRSARLTPPDFEEVTIDEHGNVCSPSGRVYKWAPSAQLDGTRLTILANLNPVRTCLIKCISPFDRYIAFQFRNGVTVLTCPAMGHTAYYKRNERLRLEGLVGMMRDQTKSRGFKALQHIVGWPRRLEQIVLRGRVIAPRANRPDLPEWVKVKVDGQGRVTLPDHEHFKWAPKAKLDRNRLKVLKELGPSNIYLVRCIDMNNRYLAFVFKSVIVLICPVKSMATYWVARGRLTAADLPRMFPNREVAMKNGAQRFHHIKSRWPTRLREIVEHGRPITYFERGKRTERGPV